MKDGRSAPSGYLKRKGSKFTGGLRATCFFRGVQHARPASIERQIEIVS